MNRPMMDYRMMRDMARGRRRMNVVGQRTDMAMDGRNPYGSRGGYVMSGRRDRGMMESPRWKSDHELYETEHDSRRSADYGTGEYNPRDSIYNRELYGYYGDTPFEIRRSYPMRDYNMDYGRGGRRDYGYDYNYDMDYGEDYGEKLNKEELEHWRKKLEKEVGDEQSKNFFKKENVEQKAKQMGIEMKHFTAEELSLAAYMLYSDYCKSLKPYTGQNMDVFIKMGEEFLNDPDSEVKGGEKLALYHDIVTGEMY